MAAWTTDTKRWQVPWRFTGALRTISPALALLCLGMLLAHSPPAHAAEAEKPSTVEIEASGEVFSKPDLATLYFVIDTQAATAQEAGQANARLAEKFRQAVKEALSGEEHLKSLDYRVGPVYQTKEVTRGQEKVRETVVVGYQALHLFEVGLRDLGKVGKVSDVGLKGGATRVEGPVYDHTKREELQRQAAVAALTRARKLAEALAQTSGMKVKRLQSVTTRPEYRSRTRKKAKAAGGASEDEPETVMEVGEEKFEAQVTAIFELSPVGQAGVGGAYQPGRHRH